MQSTGVQSCAKHFVDKYVSDVILATTFGSDQQRSEQAHGRMFSSSNVDDRTQREVYAMPFVKRVMAGVAVRASAAFCRLVAH